MAIITAQLKDGFSCEIDEAAIDDNFELVEAYAAAQRGEPAGIVDVVDIVLGDENKRALKEHLRATNGRISAASMFAAVNELVAATKSGKK